MRILVVDDNHVNLATAKDTLAGHDLTVCESYDKALELLSVTYNKELIQKKLVDAGLPATSDGLNMPKGGNWSEQDNARWSAWWEAERKFTKESQNPYWDAVLVDLLMPAGCDAQGSTGERFVGEMMPVGFSLALLAAKNGAKYVGVVTATNHHNHPASAMLDRLENRDWCRWRGEGEDVEIHAGAEFTINGAKVGFFHGVNHHVEGMTCPACKGKKYQADKTCDGSKLEPCHECNKTGLATGKDWGKVLQSLQAEQ